MFALSRCGEDGIWWHADTADTMAWAHGEQGTEAHRGMQWYSVINQWHSVAIRSTQKHSEALSGTQRHSVAYQWHSVALRSTQWHSVALSGTQWHSVALRSTQKHSVALSGTQWHTHLQQLVGGQAFVEPLDPEGIVGRRDHCLVLGLGHRAR
jgi:hypothetical protein